MQVMSNNAATLPLGDMLIECGLPDMKVGSDFDSQSVVLQTQGATKSQSCQWLWLPHGIGNTLICRLPQ